MVARAQYERVAVLVGNRQPAPQPIHRLRAVFLTLQSTDEDVASARACPAHSVPLPRLALDKALDQALAARQLICRTAPLKLMADPAYRCGHTREGRDTAEIGVVAADRLDNR